MKVTTISNLEFTDHNKLRVIVELDPAKDSFAYHYLAAEVQPFQLVFPSKTQDLSTELLGACYIPNSSHWTTNYKYTFSIEYVPTIIKYTFTLSYISNTISKAILQEISSYYNKDVESDEDQWDLFSHLKALACYYF